jgi:hypothetical protein
MEDKLTIRVPQRRYGSGEFTDLIGGKLNLGDRLGACGALQSNLTQFMTGSPIIDYSTMAFSSTSISGGTVMTLDTSRPASHAVAALTSATPYSQYTANLKQNLPADEVSVATGSITVYFGTLNVIVSAPQHSSNSTFLYSLYDAAGNQFLGSYGQDEDYYDENGNYVITVGVDAPIVGGTLSFDIINPTYTEELNWSDMISTTRSNSASSVPSSTLLFDTGRKTGLDPSDAMGLYDIQGMSFQGRNIDTQVFPVANLSHNTTFARGGFGAPQTYSTATNTIYSQFGAGRAVGSVDPASLSDRAVDYFTIFRGHGYIRMLGQVADPATGLPAAETSTVVGASITDLDANIWNHKGFCRGR